MIVSMYRKVVHNINPERYERYTTAFIWGYPFLMACVPLLLSAPNFGTLLVRHLVHPVVTPAPGGGVARRSCWSLVLGARKPQYHTTGT